MNYVKFPSMSVTWGDQSRVYGDIVVPVTINGDWAPGLWAGTEGLVVVLDDKHVTIIAVDFQERRVKVSY